MPKLVSVSLSVGRRIQLQGVRHRVTGFQRSGAVVVLTRDDGAEGVVSIPRAELYAQIVEESAHLADDTEDPDLAAKMPEINLSFLSIDRTIDWWHKMILFRHLFEYAGLSPRSRRFRQECQEARLILDWVKANCNVTSLKSWSDKTLNDDLRRRRRAGFSLAALQTKGLQYCPWGNRKTKYVRAATLAQEIRKENPHWNAEAVRRMTRHRLRKEGASAGSESATAIAATSNQQA